AAGAEVPTPETEAAAARVVADLRVVDAEVLAPLHLERVCTRTEVDGAAATARGLAADRAVAVQERRRRVRLAAEADVSAMAGTFDSHRDAPAGMVIADGNASAANPASAGTRSAAAGAIRDVRATGKAGRHTVARHIARCCRYRPGQPIPPPVPQGFYCRAIRARNSGS